MSEFTDHETHLLTDQLTKILIRDYYPRRRGLVTQEYDSLRVFDEAMAAAFWCRPLAPEIKLSALRNKRNPTAGRDKIQSVKRDDHRTNKRAIQQQQRQPQQQQSQKTQHEPQGVWKTTDEETAGSTEGKRGADTNLAIPPNKRAALDSAVLTTTVQCPPPPIYPTRAPTIPTPSVPQLRSLQPLATTPKFAAPHTGAASSWSTNRRTSAGAASHRGYPETGQNQWNQGIPWHSPYPTGTTETQQWYDYGDSQWQYGQTYQSTGITPDANTQAAQGSTSEIVRGTGRYINWGWNMRRNTWVWLGLSGVWVAESVTIPDNTGYNNTTVTDAEVLTSTSYMPQLLLFVVAVIFLSGCACGWKLKKWFTQPSHKVMISKNGWRPGFHVYHTEECASYLKAVDPIEFHHCAHCSSYLAPKKSK